MHHPEQKDLREFISRDGNGTLVQINAGDIEQQDYKEYLFEFKIDTPDSSSMNIGEVSVSFDCPSQNMSAEEQKHFLSLSFADSADAEISDSAIDTAYKDVEILEKQNDVFKLIDKRQFLEAAQRLEDMAVIAERDLLDPEKASLFRKNKDKLMREENLTQADLNNIAQSSSTSSVTSSFVPSNDDDDIPLF